MDNIFRLSAEDLSVQIGSGYFPLSSEKCSAQKLFRNLNWISV